MLSRTADSIFWIARYMERAENTARLVDMGRRMGAIPGSGPDCYNGRRSEWASVLAATGCTEGYNQHRWNESYAPMEEPLASSRFLLLEPDNPSSVRACFEAARANARATRAALTREMWEVVNNAWHQFRSLEPGNVRNGGLSPLLASIKTATAQFRGAADSSALRNDGYEFLRLGFAVERLDCTARLLDVKAAPARRSEETSVIDRYRWIALLHACGQVLAYRAHFRADYDGELIDRFLITQVESPRSLMHAALEVDERLNRLSEYYGAPSACRSESRALIEFIRDAPISSMDDREMHSFLHGAIAANSRLTSAIAAAYHFAAGQPSSDADTAQGQADQLNDSNDDAPPQRKGETAKRTNGAADPGQGSSGGQQMQM